MNNLQVISNSNILGKEFKIYGTNEEPLFLAKDVAEWIDHNNITLMLGMVDEEEKLTYRIHNSGQMRQMWFLTEDGLYEVLMQSRKSIAKQFKKQVKHILKELRTKGRYEVPTDPMSALKLMFEVQGQTKQEVEEIKSKVIELKENQKLASDECDHLKRIINKRVMAEIDTRRLYGNSDDDNKSIRRLMYKDINREVNNSCYVGTRTQIRQKHADRALKTAADWRPSQSTLQLIGDILDKEAVI